MSAPQQPADLPPAAQWRLQHSFQQGAAKSSLLGPSGFVLLDELGFEPVGAAMGIAVMHVGGIQVTGWNTPQELEVYSNALTFGTDLAITRLREEAAGLGADGVLLDTTVTRERIMGSEYEYQITGTAVRFRPKPGALRAPDGGPFTCVTSVLTLSQMMSRGWFPTNIAYGFCVYHMPHRGMRQAIGQSFQNTEVPAFTESWYTARELALGRMQAKAEMARSHVVLDTEVNDAGDVHGEHSVEFIAYGAGWVRRHDLIGVVPRPDLTSVALMDRELMMTSGYEVPAQHPPANPSLG
ncbi:MAG: hypothetical protein J2P17_18990 [Mycobacterium sp.]|nr:hypothetical protein [Mycobacterium sp.]